MAVRILNVSLKVPESRRMAIIIPFTLSRARILVKHLKVIAQSSLRPCVLLICGTDRNESEYSFRVLNKLSKIYDQVSFVIFSPDLGPAYSYYMGSSVAYGMSFEVVSLTDDDALPLSPLFFEKIYESTKNQLILQPKNYELGSCMFTNHYKSISRRAMQLAGFNDFSFFKHYDDIEYHLRLESSLNKIFYECMDAVYSHAPAKVDYLKLGEIFLAVRNAHIVISRYGIRFMKRFLTGGAKSSKKHGIKAFEYLKDFPYLISLNILPLVLFILSSLVGLKDIARTIIYAFLLFKKSRRNPNDYLSLVSETYKRLKNRTDRNITLTADYKPSSLDVLITSKTYLEFFGEFMSTGSRFRSMLILDDETTNPIHLLMSAVKVVKSVKERIHNHKGEILILIPPNYPKGMLYLLIILLLMKVLIKQREQKVFVGDPLASRYAKVIIN